MKKIYIGLSLSFCMQDILRNVISKEDIILIVTSTRFDSWQDAFDHYFIPYWSQYADAQTVKETLQAIWCLVHQPRLIDSENIGHSIANGFWFNVETGVWCKFLTK